ncbi:MAG: hypothetical protein JXR76_20410 [Deltaproteobacteria bacterium]|nr:hypothetical protein [Deltaproteobacteria bacterium]
MDKIQWTICWMVVCCAGTACIDNLTVCKSNDDCSNGYCKMGNCYPDTDKKKPKGKVKPSTDTTFDSDSEDGADTGVDSDTQTTSDTTEATVAEDSTDTPVTIVISDDTETGEFPDTETGEFPDTETGEFPDTETGEFPDTETGEFPDTETSVESGTDPADYLLTDVAYHCNPMDEPGNGVFVDPDVEADGDGSRETPFKSIARALEHTVDQTDIYLAPNIYFENVALNELTDVALRGGWLVQSGVWSRDCSENAAYATHITPLEGTSTDCVGLKVHRSSVVLHSLSIDTWDEALTNPTGDGGSCYGIWIENGSDVQLINTRIEAGDARAGGYYAPWYNPDPPKCTGTAVGQGCGTGGDGTRGADGSGADKGVFSFNGFIPGAGAPGNPGFPGQNGTVGGSGEQNSCVYFCNTMSCGAQGCLCREGWETYSGSEGRCGCGGQGGLGGNGGGGGGASVAIFISDSGSNISLVDCWLQSGPGGYGRSGESGEEGTFGSDGKAGESETCAQTCGEGGVCTKTDEITLEGGHAGGAGGTGGSGGSGAGGAGGPSLGIVHAEGSVVTYTESTRIETSNGGEGAEGAPGGMECDVARFDNAEPSLECVIPSK